MVGTVTCPPPLPSCTRLAHTGSGLTEPDSWSALFITWAREPSWAVALSAMAAAAWLYLRGRRRVRPARDGIFFAGLGLVVLAVASPLDIVAEHLLSAHMVQHFLLVWGAALLVLSRPGGNLRRALAPGVNRAVQRLDGGRLRQWLRHPASAFLGYTGMLWFWHASGPYQAAATNDWLHGVEHLTFLFAGVLVFSAVQRAGRLTGQPFGLTILLLFALALQGTVLAALMTFAEGPWYRLYAESTPRWRLWSISALTDQQLAGLLMWFPSAAVLLTTALWQLRRWLSDDDRGYIDGRGTRQTAQGVPGG